MKQGRDKDRVNKDRALNQQADAERLVAARSGLRVVAGVVVIWVVLRWIRHG
jgi:hypothetical protein